MQEIIDHLFSIAKKVKPLSLSDIHLKISEEVGELATEISIENGNSKKKPGKDGLLGEAIDILLPVFHIIHQLAPTITAEELQLVIEVKSGKWLENNKVKELV